MTNVLGKDGPTSAPVRPEFHDHFSGVSDRYVEFRPRYPRALFDYLATIAPRASRVWDCAAGNGQATGRYHQSQGHSPLPALAAEIAPFWGDRGRRRRITWPLALRVGRLPWHHDSVRLATDRTD